MHSYPDFKFFVVDNNTTSKGDTLSNNHQNAVDLSFQAIEPLELNFKKEISKKESSKRVEKIAPRFKAAKEVLTQDEKAYIDRLTQALTYNFLYAQQAYQYKRKAVTQRLFAYTIYLLLKYFNQSCCLSEMKVLPIISNKDSYVKSIKVVLP